jgi:hypothetical protein
MLERVLGVVFIQDGSPLTQFHHTLSKYLETFPHHTLLQVARAELLHQACSYLHLSTPIASATSPGVNDKLKYRLLSQIYSF